MTPENDEIKASTQAEINELAGMLSALKKELDTYQEELAPIKDELSQISETKNTAYQEYLKVVAAIVEREEALKKDRAERNNLVRQMQAKIQSAERQLHDAQRIEHLRQKNADLDKRLDETMVMAKWFSAILKHQFEAAKKITVYRKMICADAPGLGKTLTALATADLIKEATLNARQDNPYGYDPDNRITGVVHQCGRKILYVCPAPLLRNVVREVQLWTDRSPVLMGNQPKATRRFLIDTLNEMDEFLVIINYEAWRRDKALLADLKNLQFDFVVLDEAHVLKDRKTGAYTSIRSLLSERQFASVEMPEYENTSQWEWRNKPSNSYVPFVLAMTGTPILNKPQDLFALLSLVDPDHFHNENYFLRDYCHQDYYTQKWGFRPGGLDSLAKRITNIYLRRTKRDAGIVLPGKHEQVHELEVDLELYPEQARARREMKQYGAILLSAEKSITAAAEIAIYTRLRQIETWPAGIEIKDENGTVQLRLNIEESQKLDYVLRMNGDNGDEPRGLLADLTEGGLVEGSRCVVFSQFKAPLQELHRRCGEAGISSIVLDGGTPEHIRDEIIRDFDRRHTSNDNAKWQVVLANYRVGGVGVTLTGATEMIMLDSEWSGGREEQATDRVHRIGQTEDVTIHKIYMAGTIDAWLENLVSEKKKMVGGFNDAIDMTDMREQMRKYLEDN
jgi:SNF2 family DNA or RNA helicase